MTLLNKLKGSKLWATAAVFLAGSCMLALAQITTPAVSFSMSMDGQPVISVPYNQMIGGPVASALQDESQAPAPIYASGGCTTTPAFAAGSNPYGWTLTNGATGCSGNTITLTFPAAAHKWRCRVFDSTSPTTTMVEQSAAATTTSVVLTNYTRSTGVVLTWVGSDVLEGACIAS